MSDVDARIKCGDVCHDVLGSGKVQVLRKAADSVAEFSHREDFDLAEYKAHPLIDIDDDQAVWTCVYLPDEPTTSFSGTYDFPAGRLARIPVEEANQDYRRLQESLTVDLLTALLATASTSTMASSAGAVADVAAHAGVPDELLEEAEELAEVESQFGGEGGA